MSDNMTEAEVIERLVKDSMVPTSVGNMPILVGDRNRTDVMRLDHLLAAPLRNTGTMTVTAQESFNSVVHHRMGETTRLHVHNAGGDKSGDPKLEAIINGRTKVLPSWEDDRVVFRFVKTKEFEKWQGHSDVVMDCRSFAMFLEENRDSIETINNSATAADIIDMARSIRGSAKVDFSETIDEVTGARGQSYNEAIKLQSEKGGKTLEIPGHFMIAVEVFDGDDERMPFTCVLRASVEEGKVKFRYKLDLADKVVKESLKKRIAQTAEALKLDPIYV